MIFTLVLDYEGGTYVKQVHARSAAGALRRWLRTAPDTGIPGIAASPRLSVQVDFLDPVPLQGTKNVWCTSAVVAGKLALFNIVATAP